MSPPSPLNPEQPGKKEFDLNYPDAELVIGLVFALGTEYEPALSFLMDQLKLSAYDAVQIKLSSTFQETADRLSIYLKLPKGSPYLEMDGKIKAGNTLREKTGRPDICALIASSMICSKRSQSEGNPVPDKRVAHIIISLKRPEEVDMLRRIYGPGFFLIGVFAGEAERKRFLTDRKGLIEKQALDLIERDQKEDGNGQRTRDTFQMADVFVSIEKSQYEPGLRRFLGLVFGHPFPTPTRDEHAMFLAYAASVRSGDLARQVGAALTCAGGEVVALGCNDVPAPWGGLYSVDDGPKKDKRDFSDHFGFDSNDSVKAQIIEDVIERIQPYLDQEDIAKAEEGVAEALQVSDSRISQIAEFGRAVHAEMDALMAAGRNGISFRNASLYTTTFPCHTCTRHIITAGLKRVVYIEPYPKSRATQLHNDAIFIAGEESEDSDARIPFEPFLGIGPRRFFDLFSLKLSSGYSIERKKDGSRVEWDVRTHSKPRVPMVPASYLEREQIASATLNSLRTETSEDAATRRKDATENRARVLGSAGEDSSTGRKMA